MFPCRRDGPTTSEGHPVANALRIKAQEIGANMRGDQIPHRARRRRPGQRLLHACRQRALPAPGQYQGDCAQADRSALDEQGYSCIYVAVDGVLAGLVPYTDRKAVTSSGACMKPVSAIP
jgi:hypothetical protein